MMKEALASVSSVMDAPEMLTTHATSAVPDTRRPSKSTPQPLGISFVAALEKLQAAGALAITAKSVWHRQAISHKDRKSSALIASSPELREPDAC